MNNLPKYWAVKNDGSQLFKDTVLVYIANVYEKQWKGDVPNNYYGFSGSPQSNGTSLGYQLSNFINNPTPLTIEEFIELSKEVFVLPEKWCIQDCEMVSKWAAKTFKCHPIVSDNYLHINQLTFPKSACYCFSAKVSEGHTLITLDQFEELVLDKKPVETFTKQDWIDGKYAIKWERENQKLIDEFFRKCNNANEKTSGLWNYYYGVNSTGMFICSDHTDLPIVTIKQLLNQEPVKKEIIGYKFKEEFLNCKTAAAEIGHYNSCYDVQNLYLRENDKTLSVAISQLKKARVFDLWFEPIYKENFQIEDWVKVIKTENGATGAAMN